MRFFEIVMAAAAAISIINLIFPRSSRLGLLLPALSAVGAAASIITEGGRLFMLPAYILSLILLIQGITGSIRGKSTKGKGTKLTRTSGAGSPDTSNPSNQSPASILQQTPAPIPHQAPASKARKAAGTTLLIFLYIAAICLAILFPVIDLPKPSGSYPVGTTLLAFAGTPGTGASIHTAEAESKGSASTGYRNIPVQIWYPASDISDKKRVNWMNSSEMSSLFAKCKNLPDILGQLTLIKTNSYLNAYLSEREENYPVILFSGGGAMFNGQNVIQMEELASHGYIVCAVGHPNDDFACEYPDGTIIPYDPEHLKALGGDIQNTLEAAKKLYGEDGSNPEFIRYVLHNCTLNNADAVKWSKDMSFVADELAMLNNGENPAVVEQGMIDTVKIPTDVEQGMADIMIIPTDVEQSMADTVKMFAGRLDMERLGIFGHSFGGAAAGETCLHDDRFKAFINMDGTPFGTAVDNVISQPLMILTTGKNEPHIISKGYSADQKNSISIYINGAGHMNFSDFNTIIPNIGKLTGLLGKIDGDRHMEIMNSYILAFFNTHLKGIPAPILESNAAEYPEVLLDVN